jgi:hypothetical protein
MLIVTKGIQMLFSLHNTSSYQKEEGKGKGGKRGGIDKGGT